MTKADNFNRYTLFPVLCLLSPVSCPQVLFIVDIGIDVGVGAGVGIVSMRFNKLLSSLEIH